MKTQCVDRLMSLLDGSLKRGKITFCNRYTPEQGLRSSEDAGGKRPKYPAPQKLRGCVGCEMKPWDGEGVEVGWEDLMLSHSAASRAVIRITVTCGRTVINVALLSLRPLS